MTEDKAKEIIKCRNCDTEFSGNFCPECGQSKKNYNRPFHFLIIDFAGNVFAFDTRVMKTLKSIFLRPGKLAEDYINGKRERYMPPFRFYVFISFIFFLLLSTTSGGDFIHIENDGTTVDSIMTDSDSIRSNIGGSEVKMSLSDLYAKREIIASTFMTWFSWSMFILMPFYGFLLWVMFRKSYKYYMGHFILAINQHAFTFIILILLMIIKLILPDRSSTPEDYLLLGLPVYYFAGVKQLYKYKWWSTVKRLITAWICYSLVLFTTVIIIIIFVLQKVSL
jgi:hypothetical protein